MQLDDLDRRILTLLVEEPRAGSREYARLLGVARGTVQSRIARLERGGAIVGYAPVLSPRAIGFPVEAFVYLQLTQGRMDSVADNLAGIPEVLRVHSTTGDGDLLCHIVARDNVHMEQVVQAIHALPGVIRTRTDVALSERVPSRILPLLKRVLQDS